MMLEIFGKYHIKLPIKPMQILVIGFYKKCNLGDNFFIEAYQSIFPNFNFTFDDQITEENILNKDAIFFGGGSFLEGEPNVPKGMIERLKNKKIFYLGAGAETVIHPWHKFLLKHAKLIAARSVKSFDKLKELNPNTILCKDLAYALNKKVIKNKEKKVNSILFIPNAHAVSKWDCPTWKHSAWEFFKSETAQAFDTLIEKGYSIDVLSMCHNLNHKDHYAAAEIVNKMKNGNVSFLPFYEYKFSKFTSLLSQYSLIVSQRFHGLVVADMIGVPSINIHHHDKLKDFSAMLNKNVDFYRCSKDHLLNAIDGVSFTATVAPSDSDMAINTNIFDSLKERIEQLILRD
jgi:polysaccharide pyruvyl transferase WcaK-like protein